VPPFTACISRNPHHSLPIVVSLQWTQGAKVIRPADTPAAGDKDKKAAGGAAGGAGGSGAGGEKKAGGDGKEDVKKAGAAKRKPKPPLPVAQGEHWNGMPGCGVSSSKATCTRSTCSGITNWYRPPRNGWLVSGASTGIPYSMGKAFRQFSTERHAACSLHPTERLTGGPKGDDGPLAKKRRTGQKEEDNWAWEEDTRSYSLGSDYSRLFMGLVSQQKLALPRRQ
jgi:hypothetical protein